STKFCESIAAVFTVQALAARRPGWSCQAGGAWEGVTGALAGSSSGAPSSQATGRSHRSGRRTRVREGLPFGVSLARRPHPVLVTKVLCRNVRIGLSVDQGD